MGITTFWMMTIYSDTIHWSGIIPTFDLISDLDLITEFDFYLIARGFHRTFATGAARQQRTLTPPDTWSSPTLGLASVLMLRPITPELVLFPDFWVSNIPRYFCFFFAPCYQLTNRVLIDSWWILFFKLDETLNICLEMVSLFPPSPSLNLFRLVGVNAKGKRHAKVYLYWNLASVC